MNVDNLFVQKVQIRQREILKTLMVTTADSSIMTQSFHAKNLRRMNYSSRLTTDKSVN
jgi:hypothetical protein